jgi:hypothetical protein
MKLADAETHERIVSESSLNANVCITLIDRKSPVNHNDEYTDQRSMPVVLIRLKRNSVNQPA